MAEVITVIDFNLGKHKDLSTLKSGIHLGLALGAHWPSGRPGFDPRPGRCVVSLSKNHLLPKSTGNTQE